MGEIALSPLADTLLLLNQRGLNLIFFFCTLAVSMGGRWVVGSVEPRTGSLHGAGPLGVLCLHHGHFVPLGC